MKKIKLALGIVCSLFACQGFAEMNLNTSQTSLLTSYGVELGALYLNQDDGGDTLTVLPMINKKLIGGVDFQLNAQAGATAYKDSRTEQSFMIAVLRLNPIYNITGSRYSLEGLLGLQSWESESSVQFDYGLRGNVDLKDYFQDLVDQAFIAVGRIENENKVTYFTMGLKKWF